MGKKSNCSVEKAITSEQNLEIDSIKQLVLKSLDSEIVEGSKIYENIIDLLASTLNESTFETDNYIVTFIVKNK